tara:strand:- start:2104 stop:3123 length:1020 start_codon:yes stop_codon:yes gene_type:complete
MAENISADVNELHCAWYLNGQKWTGGLDATDKGVYDDRVAKLSKKPDELKARIAQAEVMADKFLEWAGKHGYTGVDKVYWTAKSSFNYRALPGKYTSTYVEESKNNPTDVLVKFKSSTRYNDPYLGLSAKSLLKTLTQEAPVKNPGMGKIEDFIGQPGVFQKLLEEGVAAAHKESSIPYSGKYLNKDKVKALKDDPEFKVVNDKYTKLILGGCRDILKDAFTKMGDIDIKMYILDELLDTDKLPKYVKVTGRSDKTITNVQATVDDPLGNAKFDALVRKNKPLKYENLGGSDGYTIGVKAGDKQIVQIRFKFSGTQLATGLKMSVAPWPGSIEKGVESE